MTSNVHSKRCIEIGISERSLQSLVANRYETSGRSDVTALKRMAFESHTMVLAQLREQVLNSEAAATRKLPAVERESKMRGLRAFLTGVIVEHQLEPSHALLEFVSQQWENRHLEYMHAEKSTSREWEVMKHKTSLKKMLVKEEKSVPEQRVNSSELQVREALNRRGIAMACVDMISWEAHERYLQKLFNHLRGDAPEHFSKTNFSKSWKLTGKSSWR